VKKEISRRHDATGIRHKDPPLAVLCSDGGCLNWPAVDHDLITDLDTLTGKSCYRFDEWCKATGTRSPAKITASSGALKGSGCRRADEDEIADRDVSVKHFDAPEAKRFAWRQVQPIAAAPRGRDEIDDDDASPRQE
jgi:hypothetical protein